MERVRSPDTHPLDQIESAAIFIQEPRPGQRHLGLLFKVKAKEPPRLLHLAWHHQLRNDTPQGPGLWIHPAVNSRRLPQIASICRQVWNANKSGIPYGFSRPNDCFDLKTSEYLFGPTQHGLTCASFVLAIFHRAGLPLVNCDSWPNNRADDVAWQEGILNALSHPNSRASPEHLDAIKDGLGNVRFRPEEVAGAATLPVPPPVPFVSAQERGRQILDRLKSEMARRVRRIIDAIKTGELTSRSAEASNPLFDTNGPRCYEICLSIEGDAVARVGCWKTTLDATNNAGVPHVRIEADSVTVQIHPGVGMSGGCALECSTNEEAKRLAEDLERILIKEYNALNSNESRMTPPS